MDAKTALVVEDDKAIQNLLRDALESEGFQVLAEKDGEWALKALERRFPDVLVTDLLLPNTGGFELIQALRGMPGGDEVPVVVVSGIYRGQRHQKQAKKLGVSQYLLKPFDVSTFIKGVQAAMKHNYPGRDRRRRRARPALAAPAATDPLAGPETKAERDEVEKQAKSFRNARTARGNLKHKRFPEVLSQLYRWRATGALLIKRDRVKKIVYLREGYPIFVKSNLMSECLGRVLVREKMISEAECEESLALMKKRRRQQGTVLIEMGCISPHNLVYALQLQLESKLFDVFGWPDGEYQFNPRIDIPPQAVHLDMSLATIVYEGVRRGFSDKQLTDLLAPFEESYLAVHPDPLHRFQDVSLEADERKAVALIDGRRTLQQVIERCGLPEAQARQLIYALLAAEMVQPQQRRARKKDTLVMPARTLGGADPKKTPPPLKSRKASQSAPPLPRRDAEIVVPKSALEELPVADLRKRLTSRVKELKKQDYFEMLGVSKSAGADEVRRAYHAAVRDVHPDRLAKTAPADARALAAQIEGALTSAFEVLSDSEARAEYEDGLEKDAFAGVTQDVGRILAAEGRFRRGSQALKKGDWQKAAGLFEEAVSLYPDEGDFHTHLGWALYRATPDDDDVVKDAKKKIERGIQKSPRSDRGYLFLGQLLKATGRGADAQRQFEQAIQCNPDCTEALTELKLIQQARASR